MGTQSVRWAIRVGAELSLSPTDRSILVYLAHCRNDRTGQCNPARATIIEGTGWGDRAIRRAIATFAEKGIVTPSEDDSEYTLALDSQSSALDSQSMPVGLTVQPLDSQSSALDSQSTPSSIRKEHQIEHQENTPKPPPDDTAIAIPDRFEEFYDRWPKKVDKPAARRAWTKAVKRATPAQIIAAATAYRDNPHLPDRQFIRNPATWLNGDGWNDELPGPRTPRDAAHPQQSKAARNAAEYKRIFGGAHEHAGSIPALDARLGA